jgi:hypothetical protein
VLQNTHFINSIPSLFVMIPFSEQSHSLWCCHRFSTQAGSWLHRPGLTTVPRKPQGLLVRSPKCSHHEQRCLHA